MMSPPRRLVSSEGNVDMTLMLKHHPERSASEARSRAHQSLRKEILMIQSLGGSRTISETFGDTSTTEFQIVEATAGYLALRGGGGGGVALSR